MHMQPIRIGTRIKTTAIAVFGMLTLLCLLITMVAGCTTTTEGGGTDPGKIQKIAASVEYAAQIATYTVVQDKPSSRPHFALAASSIRSVVATGSLGPEQIQDIIHQLGAKDPNVALAINGAFVLYRIWWADQVASNIETSENAKVILTALATGIELGLPATPATKAFALAPPAKNLPESMREAYRAHVKRYGGSTR